MDALDPERDIGYLLNKVTRRFRLRYAEALTETGLTPQQASVLLALAAAPDTRLTPSAIASAIDADPATTSGVLERLTRDGWLLSEPNPGDRRSRILERTTRAEKSLPRVLAAADAVSAEATASLSVEETALLRGLLSKLCASDNAGTPEEGGE